MHELVRLAEVREARAKGEMARLLEARAEVYHSSSPSSNSGAEAAGEQGVSAEGSVGQPGVHWAGQVSCWSHSSPQAALRLQVGLRLAGWDDGQAEQSGVLCASAPLPPASPPACRGHHGGGLLSRV